MDKDYKYDPMTGALMANKQYMTQNYKYNPDTGMKLDTGDGGLFSQMSGSDWMDGAMGVGQLGLGLMNYFENKKNSKMQRAGLQQQIDQSKYAIGANKQFKSDVSSAFA